MNSLKYLISRSALIRNGVKQFYGSLPNQISSQTVAVHTPLLKFNKIPNSLRNGLKFELTKKIQEALPVSSGTSSEMTQKKRQLRKKRSEGLEVNGFTVTAFATAEEYDLEKLIVGLKAQDLYEPKKFFSSTDNQENEPDVLYVTGKSFTVFGKALY